MHRGKRKGTTEKKLHPEEKELKQNPIEREKVRKKAKRDQQIVRIMIQQPITCYSCYASHWHIQHMHTTMMLST